jgi:hypothetical protein
MKIDIHRETGLLILERGEYVIELTKEDVESLVYFYEKNKENIASIEEF